jgi:chromosome segregation ATPase
LDNTIATQKAHLADNETSLANAQKELERCKNQGKAWQAELARCKSEGDGMRDEVGSIEL